MIQQEASPLHHGLQINLGHEIFLFGEAFSGRWGWDHGRADGREDTRRQVA